MNRKASQLPGFAFAIFLGTLSVLMSGSAMGAIVEDESRVLLEPILDAHKTQSAALAFSSDENLRRIRSFSNMAGLPIEWVVVSYVNSTTVQFQVKQNTRACQNPAY